MGFGVQELSDIAEIRQLNARYNRVADDGDGPAFAACFTEDGLFEIGGAAVCRGREEIAGTSTDTPVTVHVTTEPEIELQGDTANQRVRMLSLVRSPDKTRNEFVASGWYVDELRRTPEGWLFSRRQVELDLAIDKVFASMGLG